MIDHRDRFAVLERSPRCWLCLPKASSFFQLEVHNSNLPSSTSSHNSMAATSMAAALAASLPAPTAAPVPVAPIYEAIPASMSKVIDIEAEIPLTSVQIDGMVRLLIQVTSVYENQVVCQVAVKIIKHAREAPSTTAHGLLLGLDLDGTLEVSNCFSLPHHAGDEDEKSTKAVGPLRGDALHYGDGNSNIV